MTDVGNKTRYQLFSSTDHPITGSTKLWRYLTFEKFAWLLEKALIYHARLDHLGDPFEGSLTKPYVQKRDSGALEPHLSLGIPAEDERTLNRWNMFCHFAVCWHANPREAAAMWKLYSAEHAGVAIVSTPDRLVAAVDLSPYERGILGPVEYLDFDKDDMTLPFGKRALPGLLKRKSFEHEHEVRGLIRFADIRDGTPSLTPEYVDKVRLSSPPGISVDVDLKQMVEAIYVSPLAAPYFRDVVQCTADRHGLGDLVRPSTLLGEPVF